MTQLSLLEPRARRTDPVTSHMAARSMREPAHHQRERIVALLTSQCLTHDAIDDRLGWPHPTAARRMKELVRAGLVEVCGEAETASGRKAHTYRAKAGTG